MRTPTITDSAPNSNAADVSPYEATVCLVVHSLVVGGTEVLTDRLARGLGDRFRFVVACLDELGTLGEQLRLDGYSVQVMNRQAGFDWRCARELARLFRRERVDVVHAHQYTPFFYAQAAGFFRRRPPVLFTEHGRWHPDFPRRKRIAFNRLCLRRRDRVVGVGQHVRRALIDNEGIPAARVEVIYNGINLDPHRDPTIDRKAARRALGLDSDDFAILQVARLDGLKDHSTALRTIQRVAAETPHVRLLVVGEGPELAAIEREIADRKLGENVQLLGLRQDVPQLLAASDLFLLSSISEGVPLTIIEAMAAGRAVVSTDVGGVGEIIEHDATGLLASAGDDQTLAQLVVALVRDPARRERIANAGRERAKAVFSEQKNHAAYADLYREMARVGR